MRNPDLLRAVIVAGLAWLFDTEQPPDAVVQHHGPGCSLHERLTVGFAPLPSPVVVIDLRDAQYEEAGSWKLLNPLTQAECDDVAALLGGLGRPVVDRWNGAGCSTGSFRLAGPLHPTLTAAALRYHAGCLEHPRESVFCKCEQFENAFKVAVKPTWPDLDSVGTRPSLSQGDQR